MVDDKEYGFKQCFDILNTDDIPAKVDETVSRRYVHTFLKISYLSQKNAVGFLKYFIFIGQVSQLYSKIAYTTTRKMNYVLRLQPLKQSSFV